MGIGKRVRVCMGVGADVGKRVWAVVNMGVSKPEGVGANVGATVGRASAGASTGASGWTSVEAFSRVSRGVLARASDRRDYKGTASITPKYQSPRPRPMRNSLPTTKRPAMFGDGSPRPRSMQGIFHSYIRPWVFTFPWPNQADPDSDIAPARLLSTANSYIWASPR